MNNLVKRSFLNGTSWLILLGLASGCASIDPPKQTVDLPRPSGIMAEKMAAMQQRKKSMLPPLAQLKPQVASEQKMPYEDQLFSVVARSTPMRDVLLGLAKEAEINLVIERGVDPAESISVEMHDLPLSTILDNILEAYEYYYALEGNILRIKSVDTRIFNFDYPLLSNSPTSSVGGDLLGGGSGDTSSSLTAEFTVEAKINEEDLNVWKQLEAALTGGDSAGSGDEEPKGLMSSIGKMQMNKMSGTIVITDRKANLDLIERYLNNVQESLSRQVILEAKILEVQLNEDHQYGINWSNLSLGNFLGEGVATIAANFSQGSNGLNLTYLDNTGSNTLNATINALSSQGDVNVISSPRLNVINNQAAIINVGRTIPYLNWELDVQQVGDTFATTVTPTVETAQAGMSLGVTPQIGSDGLVTLHIVPVITSSDTTQTFTYSGTTWTVPIFDVRQTDTMVSVQDGDTIILGGLIQNRIGDTRQKVPMLGDIPLLGNVLFSGDIVDSNKLELVILLTPTIVQR